MMGNTMRLFLLFLPLFACGGPSFSAIDAPAPDADVPDTRAEDARSDVGTRLPDAGPDTVESDTSTPDTSGPVDSGSVDSGSVDSSTLDTGVDAEMCCNFSATYYAPCTPPEWMWQCGGQDVACSSAAGLCPPGTMCFLSGMPTKTGTVGVCP
jgi:hypothetical protein